MFCHNITISLAVLSIFGLVTSFTSDELRVTLSNGNKLIGRYLRSFSGRPIKAFMSIPYAKPPIGHLRFKNPEPIGKWSGEYAAIREGPQCTQENRVFQSHIYSGIEDCLHLSVYVPHKFEETKSKLPVLVSIHGGRFEYGSGTRSEYGPDYFLDQDVILVTPNYRLGPLGFLSTEDENCPGNFGLKDQVMALAWTHDNIEQFGGDPESVTIFGGSNGAASVTYLMASPIARGLFSKAIAQSGTNLAPHLQPAYKGVAKKKAKRLAERFDCYVPNDWSLTIDCLRSVPAINITAARFEFYEFGSDPKIAFTPVLEPDIPGAFITQFSRDVIPEYSLKIPLLIGVNSDEGVIKSSYFFNRPNSFDELANNLEYALPVIFYYNHYDLPAQQLITKKIMEFYFNNSLTIEKQENITNLFSDGSYLYPTDEYLRLRLAHTGASSTYVYVLAHKGTVSITGFTGGDPDTFYGVSHGDEPYYLFPWREIDFPKSLPTAGDEMIQRAMVQMWVDFARTGNPTPESSYLPKWEKAETFPVSYFRIGNFHFEGKPTFGMDSGWIFDRIKFWREIDPHLPTNHLRKDEL